MHISKATRPERHDGQQRTDLIFYCDCPCIQVTSLQTPEAHISALNAMCFPIFLAALRRSKALIGSIVAVSLLAACGGGSEDINLESFDRPYAYLSNGRPEAAWDKHWPKPTYVIRTETEFRSAWESREIPGNQLNPPLPEVDFSNFMLLGVSGEKTLPCVTLRITKVRQEGDELVVESKRSNTVPPGGGCLFAQVPLFDFVLVPSTPLRVRFLPTTVVSGG